VATAEYGDFAHFRQRCAATAGIGAVRHAKFQRPVLRARSAPGVARCQGGMRNYFGLLTAEGAAANKY